MLHSLPIYKLHTDHIFVSLALWSNKIVCYSLYHMDGFTFVEAVASSCVMCLYLLHTASYILPCQVTITTCKQLATRYYTVAICYVEIFQTHKSFLTIIMHIIWLPIGFIGCAGLSLINWVKFACIITVWLYSALITCSFVAQLNRYLFFCDELLLQSIIHNCSK